MAGSVVAEEMLGARALHRHAADGVLGLYIGVGTGLEPGLAAGTTEVKVAVAVGQRRFAGHRIDGHAADGIAHDSRHRRGGGLARAVLIFAVMMVRGQRRRSLAEESGT